MGEIITIYNTPIELPEPPPIGEIEDWGMPPEEQYWRRRKLPAIFNQLQYDSDNNIVLSPEQRAYAEAELFRIKNGYWFMLNGKPTYITGRHYYYLQWWTLENKKAPEYRETSRRYYLYLEHWYNVYWCTGVVRGKGRRSGATSESSSNCVLQVTTVKNSKVGITSKTSNDARKLFIFRVQFGFRHLPFFLQPSLLNDKDSKSELVFAIPISKSKKEKKATLIDSVEGLNSSIDYQPTALNSYDSERLSWFLGDEGGKYPSDVPFSQFYSIIKETLVEGADRTGFAELPSTVNEMTKKGGAEFKLVWDDATWKRNEFIDEDDEDAEDDNEATANGLVRYFTPAYDGLAGFIGKYGESVIDEPTPEQAKYLIDKNGLKKFNGQLKYGAKKYLERRRKKLKGAALEEEIRKYPFDEIEMFMSANADCHFDQLKITTQRKYLAETKIPIRNVIFFRNLKGEIEFRNAEQNDSFFWQILAFPPPGEMNKHKQVAGLITPLRIDDGVISVDGYSNSQGGRKYGSKACAFIYRKFDGSDPHNTGLFIGMLYGRPAAKEILHEQVMMASEYYGYQVWYEHNSDDYLTYFRDRGKSGYLGVYPMNAIDPTKRKDADRHRGFPVTPFSMTKQLDTMIGYINEYCDKIYFDKLLEQCLSFDAYDRTKSDCVVSGMIALVCSLEQVYKPPPQKAPLIKVY